MANMQNFAPKSLQQLVPGLDDDGLELLEAMLQCNPANRITAKEAMQHRYLADVPDLKELQHPNIVHLENVLHTDKKLTLVFEFLDQDLKKLLDTCGQLEDMQVKVSEFFIRLIKRVQLI